MDVTERYVLGRLVGEGATACVYEAADTALDRDVAVKVFRTADLGEVVEDGHSERFREEIRILTSLVHPHLLPLYDTGRDADGRRFMVMPLVRGSTLARLTARGPVPPREVKRIGKALAGALSHIHVRGIVHRDVKPSNVLLDADGTPYLADFGFAHAVDGPALTATNCVVGTAGYLAPEQAEGLTVPPVADVYALGLVLLEALTGERTYRGTPMERAAANALRPPNIPARLGPGWLKVLRAMTAWDPAVRATAEEAGVLLELGEDELPEVTAADDTMELTPVLGGAADAGTVTVAGAGDAVLLGAGGSAAPLGSEASAASLGSAGSMSAGAESGTSVRTVRRTSQRRLVTAGAVTLAAVAVLGLGAGSKLMAYGDSGGNHAPAPAGPGAGAAGPRDGAGPATPSASTGGQGPGQGPVAAPVAIVGSNSGSASPGSTSSPAAAGARSNPSTPSAEGPHSDDQVLTTTVKCPPGHKGEAHGKHKC